jgi:hypothetical protein
MKLELFWQRGTLLGLPIVTPMNAVFDVEVEPEHCRCSYCETIRRCDSFYWLKKEIAEGKVTMPTVIDTLKELSKTWVDLNRGCHDNPR